MRIVYCTRSDAFFFFLTDFPLANGINSFHTKFFIPPSYEKGVIYVRSGLAKKEKRSAREMSPTDRRIAVMRRLANCQGYSMGRHPHRREYTFHHRAP